MTGDQTTGFVKVSGKWLERLCHMAEARIKNRHEAEIKAIKAKKQEPTTWWDRFWASSDEEDPWTSETYWQDQYLLNRIRKLELLRDSSVCHEVTLSLETFQWIHGWAGKPEVPAS